MQFADCSLFGIVVGLSVGVECSVEEMGKMVQFADCSLCWCGYESVCSLQLVWKMILFVVCTVLIMLLFVVCVDDTWCENDTLWVEMNDSVCSLRSELNCIHHYVIFVFILSHIPLFITNTFPFFFPSNFHQSDARD